MRTVKGSSKGRPQVLNLTAVTLTRGGTGNLTATFTCTQNHDLTTGDRVFIRGADKDEFNTPTAGKGSIVTVTSATVFTYLMPSDPGGNATVTNVKAHKALSPDQYDPFLMIHPESGSQMIERGGGDGGRFGGRFVSSSDGAVTGNFCRVVCVQAASISSMTCNFTNIPGPLSVPALWEMQGDITGITLASGVVQAYNSKTV